VSANCPCSQHAQEILVQMRRKSPCNLTSLKTAEEYLHVVVSGVINLLSLFWPPLLTQLSLEWHCHHVTCELIGTSRKLAA